MLKNNPTVGMRLAVVGISGHPTSFPEQYNRTQVEGGDRRVRRWCSASAGTNGVEGREVEDEEWRPI